MSDVVKRLLIILVVHQPMAVSKAEQNDPVPAWNVPPSVIAVFARKQLDRWYDISSHLNPFYLRGDFNGDGKPDFAVLLKQKKTNKIGIGIIHAGRNDVVIIGAGTEMGNGGDNFDWMDYWYVYSKVSGHTTPRDRSTPRLIGEALYVGKSEAASALIYWNGKKYSWRQMGD